MRPDYSESGSLLGGEYFELNRLLVSQFPYYAQQLIGRNVSAVMVDFVCVNGFSQLSPLRRKVVVGIAELPSLATFPNPGQLAAINEGSFLGGLTWCYWRSRIHSVLSLAVGCKR